MVSPIEDIMVDEASSSPATAQLVGHPIHSMLVPFPVACFTGALATDLAYWATASVMWETFSIWLIAVGLVTAGLAMVVGLLDFGGSRRARSLGAGWIHAIGNMLVFILSFLNAFVHSRDGYTAVVPEGLILSALVVVLLAITGWLGHWLAHGHHVGAAA